MLSDTLIRVTIDTTRICIFHLAQIRVSEKSFLIRVGQFTEGLQANEKTTENIWEWSYLIRDMRDCTVFLCLRAKYINYSAQLRTLFKNSRLLIFAGK